MDIFWFKLTNDFTDNGEWVENHPFISQFVIGDDFIVTPRKSWVSNPNLSFPSRVIRDLLTNNHPLNRLIWDASHRPPLQSVAIELNQISSIILPGRMLTLQ